MRHNTITQELVNIFPSWSKVRADKQSVGYQVLNVLASPIEDMEKEIQRGLASEFVVTTDLDTPDIMYRVDLDTDFVFDLSTSDPLNPRPLVPTVSGYIDSNQYAVQSTHDNTLKSTWRDFLPSRLSLGTTKTGNDLLLKIMASGLPQEGNYLHHLGGGHVFIETVSGLQYITNSALDKRLLRGQVSITGKTRKGTTETENIFFGWDQRQKTFNEWQEITQVNGLNLEDTVKITIRSMDFGDDYISNWNLRYSQNRRKIDEFWALGTQGVIATLDRVEYATDEWQQLIHGIIDKSVVQQWELLDANDHTVSGVDLALQPFTDRIWIVDSGNNLYVYDLNDTMPDNLDLLAPRTPGSHVQFDADTREVVFNGDNFIFTPWHARPLQEIARYRIWYQDPTGTKYGLLSGTTVAFNTDFWVYGQQIQRTVEDLITFTPTIRGEYLFVIEVYFEDDTYQEERAIFRTVHKDPIAQYDISSLVSGQATALEFDADQKLWIKTASGYYQLDMHYDVMLIDYDNKVIYFRENYDSVDVITND